PLKTMQWLSGTGKTELLAGGAADYHFPRLSPDGTRLAIGVTEGGNSDIWVYELERGSRTRLTNGMEVNSYPAWTPDGRYVVFWTAKGMFWTRADGADKPQLLTPG